MSKVKVLAASINDKGQKIASVEVEYGRIVHGEVMTHRCLVGETELCFDLPSGKRGSPYRSYKMTIEDFYDKWVNGSAERKPARHKDRDTSRLEPNGIYTAKEASQILGYSHPSAIRTACRNKELETINPEKNRSEDHLIRGSDLIKWCNSYKSYRQKVLHRLKNMQIRAFDVDSGEVIHTNITDIWEVGLKPTFTLKAGEYSITGTEDHPVLTKDGWKDLGKLTTEDQIVVVCLKQNEHVDKQSHTKIDGVWRCKWQRDVIKEMLVEQGGKCKYCREYSDLEIHHIVPVHVDPTLCFERDNVVAICKPCHKKEHKIQGWQKGNPLNGYYHKVDSVTPTGKVEKVYDLSVADSNHNFVANGIVVHNCFGRNGASSRAIPTKAMRNILTFSPEKWGSNKSGMQAGEELTGLRLLTAKFGWEFGRTTAKMSSWIMSKAGLHKQWANRPTESYQWMKLVITATDWDNFFNLRCSDLAQPEIESLAEGVYAALSNVDYVHLKEGEWHTPYYKDGYWKPTVGGGNVDKYGYTLDEALKISASCTAQTSYRRNDDSLEKAERVFDRLMNDDPKHASPTEHQATPITDNMINSGNLAAQGITHITTKGDYYSANLKGWVQYRHTIEGNTCYNYVK